MRLFIGGDFHCGSVVGLTPPDWQQTEIQAEQWSVFCRLVRRYGPFDVGIINGDAIDGQSSRTGGADVITTDRRQQCLMARTVADTIGAADYILTYGTPYHGGQAEDFEAILADYLDAPIYDHARPCIEGVQFSIKHKIGASTLPHGRFTALARDALNDFLWSTEKDQHPKSQVLIRSHVHYHRYCGQAGPDWWLAMTLLALQGLGSKYGARQCSAPVDWGFVKMYVQGGRVHSWDVATDVLAAQRDPIPQYAKTAA